MLASLDEHNLASEQASLDSFYASVRRRVEGVQDADGKQRVIVELYDKFFATAFKRTVDRLGIVYTPIEIVDFILRSADEVLRAEFGQGPHRRGRARPRRLHRHRHVHHPTADVRADRAARPGPQVRQRAARQRDAAARLLHRRGQHRDHLRRAGQRRAARRPGAYEPFPGLVLTDTFQSYEDGDRDDLDIFPENNERIARQRALPITVIVGNPPYSVGQDSANDDNANQSYPTIDAAIRETYAARSTATNKNSLYDSYIRAIKWASLRIQDRGVIAFVTNGGWLDANTADGMRLSLAEEFSAIHVFNLRGNQRTAGEQSRREGGKVFGGGSRATVAVTVLVKNPAVAGAGHGALHRHRRLPHPRGEAREGRGGRRAAWTWTMWCSCPTHTATGSTSGRRTSTRSCLSATSASRVSSRSTRAASRPTGTPGCYNVSARLPWLHNMQRLLDGVQRGAVAAGHRVTDDPPRSAGTGALIADSRTGTSCTRSDRTPIRIAIYRPFTKQVAYFDRGLNDMVYRLPCDLPTPASRQHRVLRRQPWVGRSRSALVGQRPCTRPAPYWINAGQFFPRWTWEPVVRRGHPRPRRQPLRPRWSTATAGSTTSPTRPCDGGRRRTGTSGRRTTSSSTSTVCCTRPTTASATPRT